MALTPKQEKFCEEYHKTSNASEAYRRSYDAINSAEKTIWNEAHLLLKNPEVAERIKQLQEESKDRHMVTVDSITAELEEARKLAIGFEQMSASISATMGKAKLHGLLVDKAKVEGSLVVNVVTGINRDE